MVAIKISTFAALGFAALAMAQDSPTGMTVRLFPNSDCSTNGYFTSTTVQDNTHCTNEYLDDPNFEKDTNGKYKIYFQAPFFTGDYEVIIQTPLQNTVDGNPCGYPAQMLKSGECQLVEVDTHWFVNQCQTEGQGANCPSVQGRRDASPLLTAEASPAEARQNRTTKPRGVHMSKRANCAFNPSNPNYSVMAGDLQRITELYDNTASQEETTVALSTSTTTGSTQSFGVDISEEAGLFDIIQESVSFSYDYTYEQSRTIPSMRSFTFPAGQAGYGAFIPYYQCVSGSFSGSDCGGIPVNSNGDACIPQLLGGNKDTPDGEYRTVQT